MKKPSEFFSSSDQDTIVKSIENAEKKTSGEIRIRVESNSFDEPVEAAVHAFELLSMHETEERNGVLFYLSIEDRQFVILGDIGIHEKVPENFWENISEAVTTEFKKGNFTEGLSKGIKMAGEALSEFFPYASDDINELSNAISFEE